MLREQVIEVRWERAVHLLAVEENRARVLLAAKDELGFALANGLLLPGREQRRHPHAGDRDADQQSDQNVPAVVQSRSAVGGASSAWRALTP